MLLDCAGLARQSLCLPGDTQTGAVCHRSGAAAGFAGPGGARGDAGQRDIADLVFQT